MSAKHLVPNLLDPRRLQLIILPTEQCNFRCKYCYETFEHKHMAADVWSGLGRLVEKRVSELDFLDVSWFGGEPMLQLKEIIEFTTKARNLSQKNGVNFTSEMTTNAYLLTRSRLTSLVESGVSAYQITIDGPRGLHDQYRVRANGAPTYDKIFENITAALETNLSFSFLIRIHVRPETVQSTDDLVQEMSRLNDERVSFFVRGISDLGGPNTGTISSMSADECEVYCDTLRIKLGQMAPLASRFVPSETSACYAAAANSFVVRSDGQLSKCTVALDDPRNLIGRILPDGNVSIIKPAISGWLRGLASGDAEQLGCPLVGLPTASQGVAEEGRVAIPLHVIRA